MIFGFNTDVAGKDAVYHVQTEDRGERNPVIDSIIYRGGKILERRRTPYLPSQVTPAQVEEMVRRQHGELVEAIRSGTFTASTGRVGSPGPEPSGYAIQLLNPRDLCRQEQLCFELLVQGNAAHTDTKEVSLEVRWIVQGAVEARQFPSHEGDHIVVSFPVPGDATEGTLLVCAKGFQGREFSKFSARAASS